MDQYRVGTWQYDSAKKNYEDYSRQYVYFAARAGVTVTPDTPPSQAFSGGSSSSSGVTQTASSSTNQSASSSPVSPDTRVNVGSAAALNQGSPPSPSTKAGKDWISAVDYYDRAQSAKNRMDQYRVGTWQYDSAKKNYEDYSRQYVYFAARAGVTVTPDTPPSQAFSGGSSSSSGVTQTASSSTNQSASSSPVSPGTRVNVGGAAALTSALNNARCGQNILVANGTFSGTFRVNAKCSASNPVIIQAATPQGAVVSSAMEVSGSHVQVRGFHFRGSGANLTIYGDNHKVIGNKFEGWSNNTALALYGGRAAEVAYNEFTRPASFGGSNGKTQLRIGIRSGHLSAEFHADAHVHHNYFYDFPAKPDPNNYSSGQSDAMEVCFTGSLARSGWLIEYNLIDRHRGGHGVVDMKCSNGTTVRFNTLINSPEGRLDFRAGNGGKMLANWIENAGGIGIGGDNHEIAGNVVIGGDFPELVLSTGTVPSNGTFSDTQSANRNTLSCNRGTHYIGKYNFTYPARDNVVNSPNGSVRLGKQVNTRMSNNGCSGVPTARKLSASEVGLQGWARSGYR
jgi:hypothetical protein